MQQWSWAEMPNPKRSPRDVSSGRNSWYPFYPGFSNEFASWILGHLADGVEQTLLDPWNGSGATTATAAQLGMHAIGVDLNPAMVVIAKAKLLDPLDVTSIKPLARQIGKAASRFRSEPDEAGEPLLALFAREGAVTLRSLEISTRVLLVEVPDVPRASVDEMVNTMSPIAAFFYVALFRTTKSLLRGFAGTNPVWTKLNVPGREKPRPTAKHVMKVFASEIDSLLASESEGRPLARAKSPVVQVNVGTSTELRVLDASVHLALSSPPYCTRVDYAVATLPELSVLGLKRDSSFDDLRRRLLGTTTVPKKCDLMDDAWGATCTRFLRGVEKHPSKASGGYYLKSHVRYFSELFKSLQELSRVIVPTGKAVLVVQDSYYKELHNDLPQITVEMARACGLSHLTSRHFPLTRLLAASNPRVRHYRPAGVTATESVIVLKKD